MATTRPTSRGSSSSSNRWSAQFSDVPSPPPSYNSGASRAPSFRSSIHSSDNDSILVVSEPPTVLKKPKPSGDKWPLKPILEDEKPNVPPPPYTSPKRRRRPLFIWLCCFLAVMILAVSIVPPILVVITKSHHGTDAGNSTTSTVTSVVRTTLIFESTTIISSTAIVLVTSTSRIPPVVIVATISSSTPTPTPTPFYLGGFDAIHAESGGTTNQFLFYTDQLGNIKQINGSGYYADDGYGYGQAYDSNWSPGSPAVIASNALPGSPVQAVLLGSGEVLVFYVNNQSVVQNVVGTLSTVYSEALWADFSSYSWTAGSIASLGLITSKDPFIRICTPDQFTYGDPTPTLYLYYRTSAGAIAKYSWSNVSTPAWQELPGNELPNIPAYSNVDCQFDSGIESIWTFGSESTPQQWWRSYVNKTGWTLGASGENTAEFAALNSSILSITAGSSNAFGRSHIFFQDTNNQLVRYDINGRGANSTLANVTKYDSTVTPGTRLATWANGRNCEQDVDVYFQRDNTSQLHYLVFKDLGYYTNGYDLSDGEYYIVTTTSGDSVVDPVVTWGNPPPKGSVHIHLSNWAIIAIVFAIIVLLGLCCCCCGGS